MSNWCIEEVNFYFPSTFLNNEYVHKKETPEKREYLILIILITLIVFVKIDFFFNSVNHRVLKFSPNIYVRMFYRRSIILKMFLL